MALSGRQGRGGGVEAAAPAVAVTPGVTADAGSQALEFALIVPAVVLLALLVFHVGLVGMDLVAAQGIAREAARAAAVGDDGAALDVARRAAGGRPVRVAIDPPAARRRPGEHVTVALEVRSPALGRYGLPLWLPARATMRVEDR